MRPSVERSCSISYMFSFVNTFLQIFSKIFKLFLISFLKSKNILYLVFLNQTHTISNISFSRFFVFSFQKKKFFEKVLENLLKIILIFLKIFLKNLFFCIKNSGNSHFFFSINLLFFPLLEKNLWSFLFQNSIKKILPYIICFLTIYHNIEMQSNNSF